MATSVVPPPMSTTIDPEASVTGKSAPIAKPAIGSSIRKTLLAPKTYLSELLELLFSQLL